jgi:two-component sensor histidine kinase
MEPLNFNRLLSVWRPKDSNTIAKSELFDKLEKELQQAVKIQNTIIQLKKDVGVA